MTRRSIIIFLILFFSLSINSQQTTKSTYGPFLLKGAMVHSVTNGSFQADVLIVDDRIQKIAENISDSEARSIDCSGLDIYPGFIDSGTKLGLAEIKSVSLTQDHYEHGDFTPHMDALTAINPNSVNIPVTRVNGITTVLSTPTGRIFHGKAALIHLHGYTPDQMFAGRRFIICNFPTSGRRNSYDKRTETELAKSNKKKMKRFNDFWKEAIDYGRMDSLAKVAGEELEYNPQLEAMLGVISGIEKLIISVNKKADILHAIEWSNKQGITPILSGVSEGWRVADSIAKYNIPVIVGPILQLPSRNSDRFDTAYKNASIMQQAGVLLAIKTGETENVRNLPYHAGFAANYGLGKEEALKAITINPAKIFDLEDQIGSIEEGKQANLFVCAGDPFETKTQIKMLFINGWNVPLESRHSLLNDEFLERNPGLKE